MRCAAATAISSFDRTVLQHDRVPLIKKVARKTADKGRHCDLGPAQLALDRVVMDRCGLPFGPRISHLAHVRGLGPRLGIRLVSLGIRLLRLLLRRRFRHLLRLLRRRFWHLLRLLLRRRFRHLLRLLLRGRFWHLLRLLLRGRFRHLHRLLLSRRFWHLLRLLLCRRFRHLLRLLLAKPFEEEADVRTTRAEAKSRRTRDCPDRLPTRLLGNIAQSGCYRAPP